MADAFLVEPQWLQDHLADPKLAILDVSWNIPEAKRDMRAEFRNGHIPGSRFLDLDAVSDKTSPYVNMLPDAATFAREIGALGIGNDTTVIVYDSGYVSARVWWMFSVFGHNKVRVLNGGWKGWIAEKRPIETGEPALIAAKPFKATLDASQVADWREVLSAQQSGTTQIVDARTRERFTGEMPSGYPGVPGGHMPGATNIPWATMIPQSGTFTFIAPDAARTILQDAGVDETRPVIATCGSGVTAAILAFQLARLGRTDWKIYDGSWHEWGQRQDLPKVSVAT